MTFWEHIEELRKTLLRVILIICCGMIAIFIYHQPVYSLLKAHLPQPPKCIEKEVKITNYGKEPHSFVISHPSQVKQLNPGETFSYKEDYSTNFIILSPTEGLTTTLKLSFWLGLISTSPFWLYQLLSFILPALTSREKRCILPFLLFSFAFFSFGLAFCYFFTLPLANVYLNHFNAQIGINQWSLAHYIDYTLILLIGNALAFEGITLLFCLVHWGALSPEMLKRKRRLFIVFAFIIGAILTPPDIFTQIFLAIPLILFYELAILYSIWINRPMQTCELVKNTLQN